MIAKSIRGRGFKGAVAYVAGNAPGLPDQDRVAWVACCNLASDDPARAAKLMAWTALHADDLKRSWNLENPDATVKLTGRKCARPVYHLILSWAPEENPSRAEMERAAAEALDALGMGDHEHVIAAHTDGVARHLHIVANLVHPDTGKAASLQNDRIKLQEWALGYERAQGQVRCTQRQENFNKRASGENVIDFASRQRDRDKRKRNAPPRPAAPAGRRRKAINEPQSVQRSPGVWSDFTFSARPALNKEMVLRADASVSSVFNQSGLATSRSPPEAAMRGWRIGADFTIAVTPPKAGKPPSPASPPSAPNPSWRRHALIPLGELGGEKSILQGRRIGAGFTVAVTPPPEGKPPSAPSAPDVSWRRHALLPLGGGQSTLHGWRVGPAFSIAVKAPPRPPEPQQRPKPVNQSQGAQKSQGERLTHTFSALPAFSAVNTIKAPPAESRPSLPTSADEVKSAQRQRMTDLRARHKSQWNDYRADWERVFKMRAQALKQKHQSEADTLKAKLRAERQAAYTIAKQAVLQEVKARYAPQWAHLKSVFENRLNATYAPFRPRMMQGYWQDLRTSIKAARANSYATLKAEQSKATQQALDQFHARMKSSAPGDAAWEALRARHTAERQALTAQVARDKQSAKNTLVARQQQDRDHLATHHRSEWQTFNRSRAAQTAQQRKVKDAQRRVTKSAERHVTESTGRRSALPSPTRAAAKSFPPGAPRAAPSNAANKPGAAPLTPAEKALRAQSRHQAAQQKQAHTNPRPSAGRRLHRPKTK